MLPRIRGEIIIIVKRGGGESGWGEDGERMGGEMEEEG